LRAAAHPDRDAPGFACSALRVACLGKLICATKCGGRCHGYFSGLLRAHQSEQVNITARHCHQSNPNCVYETLQALQSRCATLRSDCFESRIPTSRIASHHTTMADDSRQPEEQVAPRPRAPANSMPGGTAHTAGGEKVDGSGPSYIDAVRSLGPEYYLNFHKRPCVRDSQLQGIAAGFAGGSLAAILGSKIPPGGRRKVASACGY
jgi:hypothetical protein